ncbi:MULTISPECIES: DHA2 family efflux MFS transporter permease subunit [unclassified Bacillus (in: firmicutes)]|uniref:DHA2 family efflux MFS transporter permease subunit n=1 Tax=Bacillaceae TaxID=186817 RepID=UPI0006AEB4B5|nr:MULTISPECIES: DHA2 family efflux MFS transporter permease subunit [unclassified Bacillus (in: firmicutes)]ALC85759.1 MFS transporter [Bacillus sp. FJAT-22090]MDF2067072.1 DHA2 family efflux MFS transporter permease subunit [Bacillus sp. Cr_A10]
MNHEQQKPPYAMIAILFVGAFIAFLNNTLLNVALPTIMTEFKVKPSIVQWLTTGYMLVNGILVPASAFFVQRFSNRKLFITAMVLFTAGTALAAFAPEFWVLILARMIQAAGSAMMMPLLMNVMLTAFPIERRGSAMGMFGLVMILAPAIGPTLSGFILEHYEWRVLFEIILPFAIIVLLFAIFKLRNITPNSKVNLDVFSLILSSIGFGALLYGFSTAGDKGWDAPIVYGTIIVGFISLIVFVWRQLKLDEPMLDVRIYKYPMFALSSVISIVVSAAMFSGMILTPLYVQTIRGISPFHSGLLMLPGAIAMGLMSPITGKLFDKYGARVLAITGLIITTIATYLMSDLAQDSDYYYIMAVYTIRMFGMSMIMMPIMTNGLNQLPMNMNPHGTAMNNTLQQVSGAIGSAIFLTIMNAKMESSAKVLATEAAAAGKVPTNTEGLVQFQAELGMKAMLEGINFTFFIATLVTVVALILAFFVKRVDVQKKAKPL